MSPLDAREARRAQLKEAAAGIGDLIMASLAGRIAEARDNPEALQRLQRLAQRSISAGTRHIARELELLGPPPMMLQLGEPDQ